MTYISVLYRSTIIAFFCATATAAAAQETVIQIPDIEIIGTTPLPGTGVPVEDVPSKVQTFDTNDFQNSYSLDLSSMLESKAGGVSTVEVQNNPFQKGKVTGAILQRHSLGSHRGWPFTKTV